MSLMGLEAGIILDFEWKSEPVISSMDGNIFRRHMAKANGRGPSAAAKKPAAAGVLHVVSRAGRERQLSPACCRP